jgi:hypothetical protein
MHATSPSRRANGGRDGKIQTKSSAGSPPSSLKMRILEQRIQEGSVRHQTITPSSLPLAGFERVAGGARVHAPEAHHISPLLLPVWIRLPKHDGPHRHLDVHGESTLMGRTLPRRPTGHPLRQKHPSKIGTASERERWRTLAVPRRTRLSVRVRLAKAFRAYQAAYMCTSTVHSCSQLHHTAVVNLSENLSRKGKLRSPGAG